MTVTDAEEVIGSLFSTRQARYMKHQSVPVHMQVQLRSKDTTAHQSEAKHWTTFTGVRML